MADLGNLKIKDTYQLVLQADASGNLQKLDGTSPSLTINSAFTYNVGTLVDGYVLKSNGSGVASWGALNADIYLSAATLNGTTLELDTTSGNTLSVDLSSLAGDSYWSANTDGSISPSGLTTSVGIGTTTPNSTLTVVGGVSATTFLSTNVINATTIQGSEFNSTSDTGYKINTNKSLWVDGGDTQVGNTSLDTDILGTTINLQTATTVVGYISGTTDLYLGSTTYTSSTIAAQEQLTIKGRGVDNDYMTLRQDQIDIYINAAQYMSLQTGGITFNASSQDYDFSILGDDTTTIFKVVGESGENRIRIRNHLTIGPNSSVSHADSVKWGLAVTGSSLFYSGGSDSVGTTNAIQAYGNISGSTNLYVDKKVGIGTSNPNKTLTVVGDISANTINFSLIDGGTF